VIPVGRNDFVNLKNPDEIDVNLAKNGWDVAKKAIRSKEYQIVILDEMNVVLSCGLLPLDEVLDFLREKHEGVEIVTTGRWAPQALLEMADLVTEMREIRHPFATGMESREGIDH
jgi:cob(I)alamin adenosyltransferase